MIKYKTKFKPTILDRGYSYYYDNCVGKITKKNNEYSTTVEGSKQYNTSIIIKDNEFISGSCSCAYDDGYCKHLAALLISIDEGENKASIEKHIPKKNIEEIINNMNEKELRSYLL